MKKLFNKLAQLSTIEKFGYILLVFSFVVGVIGFRHNYYQLSWGKLWDQLFIDFYANVAIDSLSVSITILVIDKLMKKRAEQEEMNQLIRDMSSQFNMVAVEAIRKYQEKKYPQNFEGKILLFANLENAEIKGFRFIGANFVQSNFNNADLLWSFFNNSRFDNTTFKNTKIYGSWFTNSKFVIEQPDLYIFKGNCSDPHG